MKKVWIMLLVVVLALSVGCGKSAKEKAALLERSNAILEECSMNCSYAMGYSLESIAECGKCKSKCKADAFDREQAI